MLLYRFLNTRYGIEALQTKSLKVGRLLELNDPLDCQPVLTNQPVHVGEDDGAFERRFFRELHENIGILCYSTAIEDTVVWSHYADAHKGLALGFDSALTTALNPVTLKVTYPEDNRRARLGWGDLQSQGDDDEDENVLRVIGKGFNVKAASWSYEKEYRDFFRLSDCRMVGPHYFCDFPLPLMKVVLGLNCPLSVSDVQRALNRSSEAPLVEGPLQIARAAVQRDSYNLQISPQLPQISRWFGAAGL
jgi:Protein of unknown function (DUF2971)